MSSNHLHSFHLKIRPHEVSEQPIFVIPNTVRNLLNQQYRFLALLEMTVIQGSHSLEIKKTPEIREILARLRKYRGKLPADFKFDRIEAHERE